MTQHLLKERKGEDHTAKCGLKIKGSNGTTVWWTDVDCPKCIELMDLGRFTPPRKTRRYKQR